MKILTAFGTRPEVIKIAPVVKALAANPNFDAKIRVTAQHRQMLDQVLEIFDIKPDIDDLSERPVVGIIQNIAKLDCQMLVVASNISSLPPTTQAQLSKLGTTSDEYRPPAS